jgi:hypothetical protein
MNGKGWGRKRKWTIWKPAWRDWGEHEKTSAQAVRFVGRNSKAEPSKNEAAVLPTQLQGSLDWLHMYVFFFFFFQKSWIGSLMPLSALIGGIAGGPLIETIGRKTTILSTALPFIVCKYLTQNTWPSAHTLEVSTYNGLRLDYVRRVCNCQQV